MITKTTLAVLCSVALVTPAFAKGSAGFKTRFTEATASDTSSSTGILSVSATNGTDNASNTPYNDGWATGDNGGTGFGAWNLTTSGTDSNNFAGVFLGDSRNSDPPTNGGDINTSGVSFAMFGTGTAQSNAFRDFDNALSVGQTFSIDIVVNFRNGFKGLDLRDASTATIFNFNIGGDDYVVNNAATGNGSIGNTYSANTVFHLSFTQVDLTGGTWTITRSGGVSDSDSGTYGGIATGFKLYVGGTDVNDQGSNANSLFANNLAIVPEPSTLSLLAGPALLGGWFFLRRRRA